MSSYRKIIVIIVLLILIVFVYVYKVHVKQESVHNKIQNYIVTECVNIESCAIELSDFTDFEWDTFYFVETGALLESSPEIISAPLPKKFNFGNAKYIFTLKNQLVFFEEVPLNDEYIPDKTVYLHTEKGGYDVFEKSESNFSVSIQEGGKNRIYYLLKRNPLE